MARSNRKSQSLVKVSIKVPTPNQGPLHGSNSSYNISVGTMKLKQLSFGFLFASTLLMTSQALGQGTSEGPEYDSAKKQVIELFRVFKTQDWKRLYDISMFSPAVSKTIKDRETFAVDFAKGVTNGGKDDTFTKVMSTLSETSVGLVIIEGKSAYVSTSCKIAVSGQKVPLVGIAKLIKVGETWKWDLSFTDDAEKAASTRTTEFLGQPVTESKSGNQA